MTITTKEQEAIEFAKYLDSNYTFNSGVKWQWIGFNTIENAQTFNDFCILNDIETRGIYPNDKGGGDVRFRS